MFDVNHLAESDHDDDCEIFMGFDVAPLVVYGIPHSGMVINSAL